MVRVYNGGCTNPSAENYDETADFENGTCTFGGNFPSVPDTQVVYGCMDAAAQSTYNPNATLDDGSCVYNGGCTNPSAENYDETAISKTELVRLVGISLLYLTPK